jgi:predicted nucleotidyltransferase
MKPSTILRNNRAAVLETIRRARTTNPRVFGSAADGVDTVESDLDILVDPLPGVTLFELGEVRDELEELLGVRVDVLTPGDLPETFREHVLAGARPL